jgi:hypothetical protein
VNFLTLFTSFGTLICCALPALLVALGMGAVVAGAVSTLPQLVWLSERKGAVFLFAAAMLSFGGWMQWRARFEPCPLDPDLAASCTQARRISLFVYLFSLAVFLVGAFVAFVLPRILFG